MSNPNKQLFFWKANLKNNKVLKEEDNIFNDIKRSELERFSLSGKDLNIVHDCIDGILRFNGVKMAMSINDIELGKSTDVINYKEKVEYFTGDKRSSASAIVGYYTGWKEEVKGFSNIEILFNIDLKNGKSKLRMTFTPEDESVKNSKFILKLNDTDNLEVNIEFDKIGKRNRYEFYLNEETPYVKKVNI